MCCSKKDNKVDVPEPIDVSSSASQMFFEREPELPAGIDVKGLRKVFKSLSGNELVAVNKITFKAYHGQVTALLGHNGAGKTTTMSMLTGMISATSGKAFINGLNIHGEMNKARKVMGLCPQHNMLFRDLNVHEHLQFFGMVS